jgi:aspartate kinase
MADAGVSLDMFTPAGEVLIFTVPQDALGVVQGVLARLALSFDVREGLAKVTLVGAGMHGVPGVMARLAEALDSAGVHVLQTADSHTTISVLVPAEDANTAVAALHDRFELADA